MVTKYPYLVVIKFPAYEFNESNYSLFLTIFILSNELSIAQNHKAKELERNIFSGNLGEHPP